MVTFSPDSTTLASASEDKTIRLWNVATGKLLRTLEGHTFLINSVAFSQDGKTMASASSAQTVKLWNVSTTLEVANLTAHSTEAAVVIFSPDGQTLTSGGSNGSIKIWNVSHLTGGFPANKLRMPFHGSIFTGFQSGR